MSDDNVNNLAEKYQSLRNSDNATDEKYQVMKVRYKRGKSINVLY